MTLKKIFFKLKNAVFGKTMVNVRKHRNIKLVTTETRRSYLVSEPRYHTTKFFTENLLAIEIIKKNPKILRNKPEYLGLSILELSEILMYEFWYDYLKLKYGKKAKWCYMDTDNFIVYIKIGDIYKDTADDVETRFDTLTNYELEYSSIERFLSKGKKIKSNWIKER